MCVCVCVFWASKQLRVGKIKTKSQFERKDDRCLSMDLNPLPLAYETTVLSPVLYTAYVLIG